MRAETLTLLQCPACRGELACEARGEVASGEVSCTKCRGRYPILAGVLVLVEDVVGYLAAHAKGVSRHVGVDEIPKPYRSAFSAALKELESEHIEEDLEAERVTALYVMNHYLRADEIDSPDPLINELIKKHWDHGPFERIKKLMAKESGPAPSLIELGCGVGGLCVALQGRVSRYLGLDSSFASVALARALALGVGKSRRCLVPDDLLLGAVSRAVEVTTPLAGEGADFVVCDLAAPPVKPGLWNLAAALNVIDMLPEPSELPRLQLKLLREGGLALQSSPYVWHPEVAAALRETLPRGAKDSAKAVEGLYEAEGFAIESSEAHLPWLFFKNARQLELYSVHLFSARRPGPRPSRRPRPTGSYTHQASP
jgi:SAM-dependent methyltransferase/uncharacterized protein YbaR (Trm112 family)